jgi:hypothetical protein
MSTGNLVRTDLYKIWHVVQNTQMAYPKELVIEILRDEFSKDSWYKFSKDQFGFPKVVSLEDLPQDAGFQNNTTTRLYIGQQLHWDAIYYPALIVKSTSSMYLPISINREKECLINDAMLVMDGYGNTKTYFTPRFFLYAGVWEGNVTVDVLARDILTRDDLVSLCNIIFADIRFEEFLRAGILIKKVSASGFSEIDDRQGQDKIFKATIDLSLRSEWRRQIPIDSVIDAINLCIEIGNLSVSPPVFAPNLTITSSIDLIDQINSL